ncbi:MAG: hypothetical protein CMJ70_16855 [Planctomycetaceae bacterium]|nr:hypothetical protein [Planctomycetaceae bacterium]HAA67927.1 hypothetical protein [Planctomycetaceae bacterium]
MGGLEVKRTRGGQQNAAIAPASIAGIEATFWCDCEPVTQDATADATSAIRQLHDTITAKRFRGAFSIWS